MLTEASYGHVIATCGHAGIRGSHAGAHRQPVLRTGTGDVGETTVGQVTVAVSSVIKYGCPYN